MRLSRDDDKASESLSIENQRIILRRYVEERGGDIVDEYIDDGWSGTNFDRPAVKRMLDDAQSGKIDTIVVKDLSRFGRNYIRVGQYIDYIFPAYGIRFIAISDNVDTADRSSAAMDMMPIMNVFNEWHAANTSKKIRAVLDASRRSGKYTNWSYPYGYKVGGDESRTALIDEDAASTVRRIFDLRLQGNSFRAIARILTDDGIPNPTAYFTKLDGGKWNRPCSAHWTPTTVMRILINPTYIGNTVQHKTTSVSYKNHKVVRVPESEWIVKENSHEPIISRDVWDRVQAIGKSVSRGKADGKNEVHALSGLLVCPDCGKKLKYKSAKNDGCFVCRTYIDLGKKYCTSHRISEKTLESIVLKDIRSMLNGISIDEAKEKERFLRDRSEHGDKNRDRDESRIKACRTRLSELDKLIQSAFEAKVLNGLPESVFAELCEKYQVEKVSLLKTAAEIEERIAEPDKDLEDADKYVERLKSYYRCETLTREMCLQLIDFITVGEKHDVDGSRDIHIYYKLLKDESPA